MIAIDDALAAMQRDCILDVSEGRYPSMLAAKKDFYRPRRGFLFRRASVEDLVIFVSRARDKITEQVNLGMPPTPREKADYTAALAALRNRGYRWQGFRFLYHKLVPKNRHASRIQRISDSVVEQWRGRPLIEFKTRS